MSAEQDPTGTQRLITVVVVDDEQLIRRAIGQALTDAGLELLGEAETTSDALRLVVELQPDIVLLDLHLPDSSGVHAIEQLNRLAPASRILILTRSERNQVVEAIIAGASGYILKTSPVEAITDAIVATAHGETVISPAIAGKLLDEIRQRAIPVSQRAVDSAEAIRAVLTQRELEIFERLASGASNQQIARELHVSQSTVANHVTSILVKLQLDNRIQAAAKAIRSGIS